MWRTGKVIVLCVLVLAGCYTVPETGRTSLNFVPESQIVGLALSQFQQLKQQLPVSENQEYIDRLTRVGRRIARESASGIPPDEWEFVVFATDELNAFALPGGRVGVFEGMMELTGTEDRLAVVVGHEVAHVDARHAGERMSQQLAAAGIATAGALAIDDEDTRTIALTAFSIGAGLGTLAYSRTHEREADYIGLLYSARSGYDPRVAVPFWADMAEQGGSRPPQFLSTHPDPEDRIRRLRDMMPQAIEAYEEATGQSLAWPVEYDEL